MCRGKEGECNVNVKVINIGSGVKQTVYQCIPKSSSYI